MDILTNKLAQSKLGHHTPLNQRYDNSATDRSPPYLLMSEQKTDQTKIKENPSSTIFLDIFWPSKMYEAECFSKISQNHWTLGVLQKKAN
jgi:hypothetical protein